MEAQLLVRPIEKTDIPQLVNYWMNASTEYLVGMGVDLDKMPDRGSLTKMLEKQIELDIREKPSYALIWDVDGVPSGHCNVNNIVYAEEAQMHLHLWHSGKRKNGLGTKLVRMSVARFFKDLQLQRLWCEPYALNPAPHRVLEKAGFQFIKEYKTIPGSINFEQNVKQWRMLKEEILDD